MNSNSHSGQLRSRFPSQLNTKSKAKLDHIIKKGNGQVITAHNKYSDKATISRVNHANNILQEARDLAAREKREKEKMKLAVSRKPSEHLRAPIKKDIVGLYIQPRVKGQFTKKLYLVKHNEG